MNEEVLTNQCTLLARRANGLEIADDEGYRSACGLLRQIAGYKRRVSEAFDPVIAKAREAWKGALDQKKRYLEPVEEAERELRSRIGGWLAARQAEDEAKRAALATEAQEAGFDEAAGAIQATAPARQVRVRGVVQRAEWKWKVVDEGEIPREFLTVDAAKITKLVRALGGETKIPGIEVYRVQGVAVRAS